MGMFMAFTFFAFLCSCCAVTVTRAFIQDLGRLHGEVANYIW
jgi:hypothetical protein